MTDLTEPAWDDEAGPLVRPFTLTQGRTRAARDDLTLITLVTTVDKDAEGAAERRELYPEHLAILRMCREPRAVAEIAARIDLPVSIAKVIIDDLFDAGHVHVRPPVAMARTPDIEILRKVRDGLRRL